jgi:hypothetical protein
MQPAPSKRLEDPAGLPAFNDEFLNSKKLLSCLQTTLLTALLFSSAAWG